MARTCEPLSAYMPHVRRVARLVGATSVYLATDSARVLADARLYASEFSFHTMNLSSAYESHDTLWDKKVRTRLRDGLAERSFREAWEATVDMMLLSECDGFVGKFTSNFFRNAYSLKAAACDCAPPFVSLDAPWCFDYGLRVGTIRTSNAEPAALLVLTELKPGCVRGVKRVALERVSWRLAWSGLEFEK